MKPNKPAVMVKKLLLFVIAILVITVSCKKTNDDPSNHGSVVINSFTTTRDAL